MKTKPNEPLKIFAVEDVTTGEQVAAVRLYRRSSIRQKFGITDRQLYNYILLLQEAVPDEFEYDKGSGCFDEEQYQALVKVWTFFKLGLKRKTIINKLRVEGV